MAAPTWNTKPAYTAAQIAARFGPGARLVQKGGKWTVAGGTMGAVSSTAPSIRDGVTAGAPGVAAAGPVPPAPASTPPLPVSLGKQAGIDSLTDRLSSLSGIFNPRRLALYAEGARGLTDQGFLDTAQADVASTGADGSTSYRIVQGPDGQLYRQATNDTNAAANARGMLFSSATREQQQAKARDLNNARDAILRQMSGRQDEITGSQTQSTADLRGQLSTAQGDYTDWRSSQPVPVPPSSQSVTTTSTVPGPAGPKGPANPAASHLGRIVRNPGAGSVPGLQRQGYQRAGGPGNVWVKR